MVLLTTLPLAAGDCGHGMKYLAQSLQLCELENPRSHLLGSVAETGLLLCASDTHP